jgi:transposase
MEAGSHSPWCSCYLTEMGFKVLVGNSRKLRAIWTSTRKTDERDAEMLARIARMDKKLFHPIRHRGKRSQTMLAVIKAREALVKSRSLMINSTRGLLKSTGAEYDPLFNANKNNFFMSRLVTAGLSYFEKILKQVA